jgi:hypothetical protein
VIFTKKINLFLLASLLFQHSMISSMDSDVINYQPENNSDVVDDQLGKINIPLGVAAFIGTYVGASSINCIPYLYYAREANLQELNSSINHDVIDRLKKKCLKKGVVIDYIYYNPGFSAMRGNAAVMTTPLGSFMFLGAGYGASKNEKDVLPLTEDQVNFIMGHECGHILHNDIRNRKIFISSIMSLMASNAMHSSVGSMLITYGFPYLSCMQELNADYYSSTDPKVVLGGADFFKTMHEREQYNDVLTRISSKINHFLFATHPCHKERYTKLKLRAKELQMAKQGL